MSHPNRLVYWSCFGVVLPWWSHKGVQRGPKNLVFHFNSHVFHVFGWVWRSIKRLLKQWLHSSRVHLPMIVCCLLFTYQYVFVEIPLFVGLSTKVWKWEVPSCQSLLYGLMIGRVRLHGAKILRLPLRGPRVARVLNSSGSRFHFQPATRQDQRTKGEEIVPTKLVKRASVPPLCYQNPVRKYRQTDNSQIYHSSWSVATHS